MDQKLEIRCPTCGRLLAKHGDSGMMESKSHGSPTVRVLSGAFECTACGFTVTFSKTPDELEDLIFRSQPQ